MVIKNGQARDKRMDNPETNKNGQARDTGNRFFSIGFNK